MSRWIVLDLVLELLATPATRFQQQQMLLQNQSPYANQESRRPGNGFLRCDDKGLDREAWKILQSDFGRQMQIGTSKKTL